MIKISQYFFLCTLLLYFPSVYSQNFNSSRGVPLIRNYSVKEYKMHEQNFQTIQANDGSMFFANFGGILKYDGSVWNSVYTKSGMRVLSLAKDSTGQIFVGGLRDFGFLNQTKTGLTEYFSLADSLKLPDEQIGEIFKVLILNKAVYYFSNHRIFIYQNKNLKTIKLTGILKTAFIYNEKVYCFFDPTKKSGTIQSGLTILENAVFTQIPNPEHAVLLDIQSVISSKNGLLLCTDRQGLFTLINNTIKEHSFAANNFLKKSGISCAVETSDQTYAFGTAESGIVITDKNGHILQVIDKKSQLADESVLSMFVDKQSALWATTRKGISKIEINSNLTFFENMKGTLQGNVNKIIKFDQKMYFATENGLYFLDDSLFNEIKGINSACWDLAEIDNSLFAATSVGIFKIQNNKAVLIGNPDFTFCLTVSQTKKNTLFAGKISKISILSSYRNSDYEFTDFANLPGDVRKIAEKPDGTLVIEIPPNEIYLLPPGEKAPKLFDASNAFTSLHISSFDKNIIFMSDKGLYISENNKLKEFNIFRKDTNSYKLWIYDCFRVSDNTILTVDGEQKNLTFWESNTKSTLRFQTPFLQISDYSIFTFFNDSLNHSLWLGGREGIILFKADVLPKYNPSFKTLITKILSTNNDSLLSINNSKPLIINHSLNSLHFEFSLPSYPVLGQIKYQYFLEGYEKDTSTWSTQNSKDYTNLAGGNYTFVVRAMNEYGQRAEVGIFRFTISTPFYKQWWMFIIYVAMLVFGVRFIIKQRIKVIEKDRKNLEAIVKERTEEIENQKEELQTQAEELEMTNEELEKIDTVVKSMNREIDFSNLLISFLSKIVEMISAERAIALVIDKEKQNFTFKALVGDVFEKYTQISLSHSDIQKRYFDGAEEVYENIFYKKNISADKLYNPSGLDSPRSMLIIKVLVDDKIDSLLVLSHLKFDDAFKIRHLRMVKSLKEHINSAFLKARVLENLQDALKNLNETQAELVRREKLASIGLLTKGIVDRIINPLNYINNFSQISSELTDEIIETAECAEINSEIKTEIKESANLIKHNLDKIHLHGNNTARIVKAMEKLLKEKSNTFIAADINSLVKNNAEVAIAEYAKKYPEHKTPKIIFNFPAEYEISILPNELGDALKLIVDNACSAVDSVLHAEIQISNRETSNEFIISIRDNGRGIPEKEISKVFDPFFTTKPTSEGSGLGLYLCKEIMELHGGKISVTSNENNYTEFILHFPLK